VIVVFVVIIIIIITVELLNQPKVSVIPTTSLRLLWFTADQTNEL